MTSSPPADTRCAALGLVMPVLGRRPKARPDLNQRRPVMHESKKQLAQNREFALAVIVEALHRGEISECDALDLAFEANGLHGEWTEERLEEHRKNIYQVAQRRFTAQVLRGALP